MPADRPSHASRTRQKDTFRPCAHLSSARWIHWGRDSLAQRGRGVTVIRFAVQRIDVDTRCEANSGQSAKSCMMPAWPSQRLYCRGAVENGVLFEDRPFVLLHNG